MANRNKARAKAKQTHVKPLADSEVWDDSSLIQTWDDAVREYDMYHSMQARGEDVEEVLRREEEEEAQGDDEAATTTAADAAAADVYGDTNAQRTTPENATGNATARDDVDMDAGKPSPFATLPHSLHLPATDTASARPDDEALKNLMMSWYYAGYYSGLYEGQQQRRP